MVLGATLWEYLSSRPEEQAMFDRGDGQRDNGGHGRVDPIDTGYADTATAAAVARAASLETRSQNAG